MSQNSGAGFGKDPLTPCHGDSLVDQSFQSLKSKEVRDSMSPTHDIKFHALSLNQPNNTGWDVQSSSEVSPDGRAFRSETVATTDGVEKINGGIAEFQGRNEQRSSASHEGDDKNFVKKASESSKTHLEEKVVIGDPNSGHTEMKTSSKTSSSSQVISSSSSTVYQDGNVFDDSQLTDDHSTTRHRLHMTPYEQQREQQRLLQQERHQQQQLKQHQEQLHSHHVDQSVSNRQSHVSEQYNQTEEKINTSSNLETERTHEENRRYVDMDKASPEYQKRVQYLMAQPGEIISNTVEYPKPNVKMITTVKRLPDGTIVRNKRYETEETQPSVESTRQRQLSNTNHTNTESRTERRVHNEDNIYSRLQKTRDTESTRHQPSTSHSPRGDHVDNVHATNRPAKGPTSPMSGFPAQIPESQTLEHYTDDVAKVATFSSVKKSSRRFSTETTSETIEEVDDRPGSTHYPDSPRHITSGHEPQAFTTHGFPSVRPNKPTQEYPTDRPQSREEYRAPNYRPSTDGAPIIQTPDSTGPSDRFPVVKPSAQMDGDVVVMSETRRSSKQKFNTERVTETEIVSDRDYAPGDHVHEPRPDFSTHGFPSVKESSPFRESSPGTFHPSSPRRPQSTDDFSTHGFPSVKSPQIPHDVHTSSPRRSQPGEDFSTHGFPSVRSPKNYSNGESSPRRSHPTEDFSTHGFPSVRSSPRSPSKDGPTTKEIPITVERQTPSSSTQRKPQGAAPTTSTTKRPSSTTESSTTTTTIRKEKEVDAAHRAFAASLRSSSPVDGSRRDSYSDHQRYTPRSSIASSKNTYRRDMREGSHDSTAPSEGSRISTGTVTRQSPGKVVGKTTVSKQTVVKTKNSHASNETIDMTPQRISKSPSPTKTITTTTVTKTSVDVPKSEKTPYSPASSSTKPRTHPNNKTPDKDDLPEHKNEPDYESSTPSDIETSQQVHRNIVRKNTAQDDDYESPSPSDHIRPISKDTSDQNTYVRETTFELTDGDQPVFVDSNQTDFSTHTGGSPSKKFPGVPDTVNTEVNKTHDLFRQTNRTRKIQDQKNTKEIVNEFITKENDRQLPRDETPDGALNSKGREPFFLKENDEPTSPTFRKKGLSRRETFEDRCRQILGMEDSGDTQGVYKTTRDTDTNFEQTTEKMEKTPVPSEKNKDTETTEFLVRIEDCEDDDQNYISNVSHVKVDTDKLYKTTFKTNVNVDELYMEPRPNRTGKSPTDNDNIPKRDYDSEDSIEKEQIITRKETTKSSRSSVTDLSRTSSPDRTHSPTRPVSENTESEPTKKAPLSKRKPSPNRENITTSTTAIRTTTTGHIDTNEPETRKKLPSTTPTKKSVSQTVPNKPSPVKTRPGVTVNKVSPEKPDFERSTRKPSSEIGTPIDRKTSPTTRLITKKPGSRSAPEPERHRKSSSKPYTYKEPNTSQTLTPDRQDSPTRKTVTKITDISETDVNFEETQSTKQPSTTRKPSPVKQTPTSDSPRQEPEWSDTSRTSSPDRQCSPTRTIVIKTTDQSETDVCFEDTEYTKRTSTKYATVKQTPTRDSPNKSSPQQEPQVSDTSRTSSPDRQRSPTRKTVTKVTDIAETDVNFEYTRSTKRPFTTSPRKPSPVKQTPIRDSPLKKSPGEEPVSDTSRTSSPDRHRSPTRTTATKKTDISETDVCLEDTDYIKRSSTKSAPVKQTPTKDSPQKSSPRQGPEVSDTTRTSSPDRQLSPNRKTVTKITDISNTDVNYEKNRSTKSPSRNPRKQSPVKQTPTRDSPHETSPRQEPQVSDTSRTSSPDRQRSPNRTTVTKKTDISETDVCFEDTDYTTRTSTIYVPERQTPTRDYPQKTFPRQEPEVSDASRTSSPDRQRSPTRKTVTKITDISETDINFEDTRTTKHPSTTGPHKPCPLKQTPTRDSPRQEPEVSDTIRTSSPDRQRSPTRSTMTKTTDISETRNFEETRSTKRPSTTNSGKPSPVTQTPTRDSPHKSSPRQEPMSDTLRTPSPDRQQSPTRSTFTKQTDISETDVCFEDTEYIKHSSTKSPTRDSPQKSSPRQQPKVSDTSRTSSPDRQRSPTRITVTKKTDLSETDVCFEDTEYTKRTSTKYIPVKQTPARDSPQESSPRQQPDVSDTSRTSSPDRQRSPTRTTVTKVTDISETDIKYQKARSTKRPSTTSPRKPSPVKQTPTKDSPHKSSPREEPEVSDTSRTSSPDRQDSPTRRTVTKTIAVSASDDCFEETKSTKRSSITSPRKTSPVKQVPLKPSAYPTPSNDKPIRKPMTKLQSEPKSYTDTVNKTKESKVYTSVTNNTRKTPSQILDQPRSVRPTTRVQQQVTTSKKERFENDRFTIPTTPRKPSKEPSKTPRKETPSTERLQTSPNARSPRKEKPRTNDDESPRTSPDVSPTRCTERRRSSNISVHTEIIIDHSRQRSPQNESPRKIDKTDEDLISKSLLQRQNKKLSVTERKESAPVHRVTRKDKDVKMSRSTSENVFKTTTPRAEKKPTPSSLSPNVSPKPDRRPNKCLTTKSINLTTMDRIINSEDMESVIIDIQHAKSSREPSPDKIIPTPVPIDVDTGKPRYPDVVQEPEDEPRRKPVVKNIPIFEEDSNDFVGCQIMEVKVSKVPDNVDNTEILDSPTIEAPKSLDYPSLEPTDDVCLLSVHEKVSKFTQNAEDTKKPKTSGTFFRDVDQTQRVHEDDVCLLTVDQKVNKFLQTAENITNESFISSKDVKVPGSVGKLPTADRLTPTPEKLAASAPQRSPELVAKIERQISRQPEFEPEPPKSRVPESTPKYTVDVELSPDRQQPQRTSTTKSVFQKEHKYEEDVHEVERVDKYTPRTIHDDIEVDELVPMTKNHTTAIELKRQKDILSRPSVFKPKGDTSPVESHPKPSSPKSHRYTERDAEVTTDVCATKNTKSQLQTSINTNVSEVKRKFEPSNRTELPVARPNQKNEPEESESEPEDQPRKRYPYDDEQSPQKISPTHEPEGSDYEHEVTLESFRQTEEHVERDVLNRKFSDGKRPVGGKQYAPDQNTLEPEDVTTEEYRRSQTKQTRKDISSHRTPVSPIKKAPVEKPTKQPQLVSHSPTRSPHYSTKSSTTKITERTVHHIPNNQRASSQEPEQILISPIQKKPQSTTPGRSHVLTESVAARRNIFEKGVNANTPTSKPHQARPGSITPQGRRPSYMDHTKSSLEHTRRDSLEINKTNYSRKTSFEDEIQYDRKPNAAVQFDIPRNPNYPKDSTVDTDELNIEEIFELHILEKLLETVTSYEIRRRIRAQIRLVKKNMQNLVSSTKVVHQVDSKAHTTKRTQVSHHDERDDTEVKTHRQRTKSGDRSVSPSHPRVSSASPVDVHADKVITKKYSSEEISIEDRQHPHRPGRSGSPSASRGTTSIHRETHVTTKDRSSRHHDELQEKERIVSTSRDRSKSPLYPMGTCGTSPVTRRPSAPRDPKQVNVTDFSSEEFSDHTSSVERKTSSIYRETQSSSQHYDEEHEIESHRSRSRSPTYPSGSSPSSTSRRPAPQISQKTRPDRSSSPEGKTSKTQRGTFMATKTTTTRSGQTLTQQSGGSMPKDQGRSPIWADRKNVLKNPTRSPTKTPTASTTRMTSSAKTSSTSRRKNLEEDCIISSYGIGPTDENGLPLFGIKALKKKPQSQPSDTTQEVTGYVVEEQYYSDNRTKPIVKRKELVYSTNPEELDAIQRQLHREISPDASAAKQIDTKYIRGDDFMSHCPEICTGSTTSTKYVRRGSVKEMSEKFIRKESSQSMTDKTSKHSYPKAGLILRTNSRSGGVDDSDTLEVRTKGDRRDFDLPSSEDDDHCTGEYMSEMRTSHMTTEGESESESVNIRKEIRSQKSTRSFLNSSKESRVVTGVDDVLERMRNADNVVEEGDTQEDQEARALLNKFLGASVIMSGVETVLPTKQSKINTTNGSNNNNKQQVKTTRVTQTIKSGTSSSPVARKTCDIEEIWDEEILKKLLEQATSYEERRKIRARLRQLMAEREEHCTTTEKSEVKNSDGAVVTTTTKVTTRTVSQAPKPVSPFAKFKQLDKQNSLQSPKSPSTPTTPGGSASGSAPIFKFTDPALNARAATVKDQLLQWCQIKTKEYENVQITNFSTSWSDGLAFCALIHHFLPDAFDYSKLTPQTRKHNFELAFTVADEKAGIAPLLDVEDMVVMKRPDWKCVFVYVQSIYRRFRNCQ